jgi:hypothetical protein
MCALLLATAHAAAAGEREPVGDEVAPAEETGGVVERKQLVDVRIVDGVARYRVTRTVGNTAAGPLEGNFTYRLPAGGAVTGFRVGDAGRLVEGKLGDASDVSTRYLELRAQGDGPPRTIAMLAWESIGAVGVRVFPVYPGDDLVVEYDVTAPLAYSRGEVHASYPRADRGDARPQIRVDAGGGAHATVSLPLLPSDPTSSDYEITVPAPKIQMLAWRWARVDLAKDRHVMRLEVAAAPRLGEVPAKARVVFVIDGSWSEDVAGIDAQLEVVRGYLTHVPDARFDVVVFDRKAHRLAGRLVPAAQLDALVADARTRGLLAPRNGSDPVVGLSLATAALAADDGTGPARVVILSDRLFPFAYEPEAALAALAPLPQGAIVHAVDRGASSGDLAEERIDGDDLGPVVEAHGGQILSISGSTCDLAALAEVTIGLVRPIRIDDFHVALAGAPAEESAPFDDAPAPLAEGQGYTGMRLVATRGEKLVVTGRLWGKHIELTLAPDAALGAHLPALLFGDELSSSLTTSETAALGTTSGVVTSETSYLAVEPDAEPSTLGYEEMTGCSGGCIGCGHSSSCTHCGFGTATGVGGLGWQAVLRDLLRDGFAACARQGHAGELKGNLSMETTGDEIVGVRFSGAADDKLARCAEEVVWNARLPSAVFRAGHRTYDLPIDVGATGEVPTGDDAARPAAPAATPSQEL